MEHSEKESHRPSTTEHPDVADGARTQVGKRENEAENQPPKGLKLVLIMISVLSSMFLVALVNLPDPDMSYIDANSCRIDRLSPLLYQPSPINFTLWTT